MEYYNNILCVTCEELTSGDNPVMKYITLYQNVRRGNIESINRGGGEGNVALYSYSSLPEKYKKRWVERHGEPEKQMREEMIRNIVKKDEKAERFFEEYRYDKNGELVALPEDVKKEYTWNASVLNALMEEFKRLSSSNNKLTGFRRNLWELLLVTSEEWRPVYGHSLPGSVGRLKALINKFRPDNYGVLVSGKYGNSNTLKIEEDGGRYLVALKRSRVPVYTDMEIFEEYNRVAPERGWKPLKSPRSLREWFSSPRVEPLWYDAVYGEMKAHQRYDRKHRTILPGRRDSLWYGDGTKLNLYYRDENGNKCTTSVYEVVDAYSEVLLGYYISDNEDYIAQYHAFRMAIQTSRHKPYEIVCDNQGGHKKNAALGLFSKISRIHRPTAPYNGESKTIENIFYRFQSHTAQITILSMDDVKKSEPIDELVFRAQYELKMVEDTTKTDCQPNSETMMLEVGKKCSQFYSYTTYLRDSTLIADYANKVSQDILQQHAKAYGNGRITYRIYKNYPTGKVTTLDRLATSNFRCEEKNEKPVWTLLSDTATILTYHCRKATCHFRGRSYTAWFTMEIPVSEGPWKLCGLPGFIIKAEDARGHYSFECTGIEQSDESKPLLFNGKGSESISRRDLNKVYERYAKDPVGFITSTAPNVKLTVKDEQGNALTNFELPYNPIELSEK